MFGSRKLSGSMPNIKTIQRGLSSPFNSTAIFYDMTISAVDITKAIVKISQNYGQATDNKDTAIAVQLLNSTTVRFYRTAGVANTSTSIGWEVIEFNNVKNIQRGTDNSLSVPISSVNLSKSMIFTSSTSGFGGVALSILLSCMYLSSSTLITVSNGNSSYLTNYWQVIEFN